MSKRKKPLSGRARAPYAEIFAAVREELGKAGMFFDDSTPLLSPECRGFTAEAIGWYYSMAPPAKCELALNASVEGAKTSHMHRVLLAMSRAVHAAGEGKYHEARAQLVRVIAHTVNALEQTRDHVSQGDATKRTEGVPAAELSPPAQNPLLPTRVARPRNRPAKGRNARV